MHQPDFDVISTRATPPAAGTVGWLRPGDPGGGVKGSILSSHFLNDILGNLLHMRSLAGTTWTKGPSGDADLAEMIRRIARPQVLYKVGLFSAVPNKSATYNSPLDFSCPVASTMLVLGIVNMAQQQPLDGSVGVGSYLLLDGVQIGNEATALSMVQPVLTSVTAGAHQLVHRITTANPAGSYYGLSAYVAGLLIPNV